MDPSRLRVKVEGSKVTIDDLFANSERGYLDALCAAVEGQRPPETKPSHLTHSKFVPKEEWSRWSAADVAKLMPESYPFSENYPHWHPRVRRGYQPPWIEEKPINTRWMKEGTQTFQAIFLRDSPFTWTDGRGRQKVIMLYEGTEEINRESARQFQIGFFGKVSNPKIKNLVQALESHGVHLEGKSRSGLLLLSGQAVNIKHIPARGEVPVGFNLNAIDIDFEFVSRDEWIPYDK